MREKASFCMFFEKVRVSKRKLEINDPKLPKKGKVSSHCEEGVASIELVLKLRNTTTKVFIKQLIWLSAVFVIEFSRKITLKLFRQ